MGVYAWNDGSRYDGEWFENKIRGTGTYTWLDGRKYQGEWLDNNMEGMGVYTWQDGRRYEGQYRDDKKHGYGVYTWADHRQYQGMWFRGKQHGLGYYQVPGSEAKAGLWEDGKRIEWFDAEAVHAILSGQLDFTQYFQKPESAQNVDNYIKGNDIGLGFNRPMGFDEGLHEVKQKFDLNTRY